MKQIDVIKKCLDNTAPIERYEDLGMLYFARTFFENCQSHRQAKIHYKMMKNALELFHPNLRNRMERQRYVKIFREGAKTTHYSFVLPLYLINLVGGTMYVRYDNEGYHGADRHDYEILPIKLNPEFILILSETHASAERFTMNIRYELESNRLLKNVFGNKTPKAVVDDTSGMWRRDSFVTPDSMIIFGQGAGQQIRGMLPFGSRPTMAIFDDIYSRKNTLTPETREKLRYWFFAEAINSIDTIKGKALLVGTMVHEDTVFTDVVKSSQWKGVEYPVLSREDLEYALSYCKYDTDSRQFELPSRDILKQLQSEITSFAWPERQTIEFILSSYKEKFEIGKTSYYYQEYLHILSAPDDESYKDHQVLFTNIKSYEDFKSTIIEVEYNSYTWRGLANLYIGIDVASSERDNSDDTCVLVGGYAHLYPILKEYDMLAAQNIHPHKSQGLRVPILLDGFLGKVDVYTDDRTGKKGIVNIVQSFCDKYKILEVTVETNAQQGLIQREIKKSLRETHPHTVVKGSLNTINKQDAINSVLQPLFQSNKIVIMPKTNLYYTIWSQLKHLGVAKHDDGPDAMKILFLNAKPVKNHFDLQQVHSSKRQTEAKYVHDWLVY